MISKLVKLNSETGDFTEVDTIRLRREALILKQFLETELDRSVDQYQIYKQVMPLVEAALSGQLKLPFPYSDWPLKYPSREDLLPRNFTDLYSPFKLTASGAPFEELKTQIINGEKFAMMEFEQEGDYPHHVKFL